MVASAIFQESRLRRNIPAIPRETTHVWQISAGLARLVRIEDGLIEHGRRMLRELFWPSTEYRSLRLPGIKFIVRYVFYRATMTGCSKGVVVFTVRNICETSGVSDADRQSKKFTYFRRGNRNLRKLSNRGECPSWQAWGAIHSAAADQPRYLQRL